MPMTKGERDQLLQLVKKREKVMKTKAEERSAVLLAEFDAQSAKIYHWDEDETWAKAMAEAQEAIDRARASIAARCKKLGIPPEFGPDINMFWQGRGHNAVVSRRAELRRAAKSRIEAMQKEAASAIEALSLDAQTKIIAHGLDSEDARNFLESMPRLDALMPMIDVKEIQELIESKARATKKGGFDVEYYN